jgi:hypothetical protein
MPPKTASVQEQINEVTHIMKNNMEKIIERDIQLGDLEDKSDDLKNNANRFATTSRKLKNKFWWKNVKIMLIMGGIILTLILVLSLIIWGASK